jgi:hypothetical protein
MIGEIRGNSKGVRTEGNSGVAGKWEKLSNELRGKRLDLLIKREYNLMNYEGLTMAQFYKTKKRSKHGKKLEHWSR